MSPFAPFDAQTQVLLIDDDPHLRQALRQTLDLAGLKVATLDDARQLDTAQCKDWPGVVVSDIRMPGIDGMELLRQLHEQDADLPVILITGHGDVPLAVQAMRGGAYDFLEKPFPSDALLDSVRRALEVRRLVLENRTLRLALAERHELHGRLIGRSAGMQRLREQVGSLAAIQADVLVLGETGAGKEVVARALHDLSSRRDGPFVAINAGALAESVVESELFGHEAGAFTGAQKRRIGKFEYANGGTLFLDEIESMSLDVQVKLLRLLQERVVERLGSNQLIPLDIRIIAATKEDLRQAADQGRFRADLYYRLNVASLRIPPLRERGEDHPAAVPPFRRSRRHAPWPDATRTGRRPVGAAAGLRLAGQRARIAERRRALRPGPRPEPGRRSPARRRRRAAQPQRQGRGLRTLADRRRAGTPAQFAAQRRRGPRYPAQDPARQAAQARPAVQHAWRESAR
ncbi:two-component response regulator [Pseudomonas aeruginosa]|nr:two-component response regulator [Pseudomonas aeruginosa]